MLSQEYLKSILHYDPETGILSWKVDRRRVKIGQIAGYLCLGYVAIGIDGKLYKGHRLAWLYMTGEWPKDEIDHINRTKHDNRWVNLREATKEQNCDNRKGSRLDERVFIQKINNRYHGHIHISRGKSKAEVLAKCKEILDLIVDKL